LLFSYDLTGLFFLLVMVEKIEFLDQRGRILICLRDFFLSRHPSEFAKACIALSHECTASVSVATTHWQDVEFAFNKLFVGPQAILAPPFVSIYLESEPHVKVKDIENT